MNSIPDKNLWRVLHQFLNGVWRSFAVLEDAVVPINLSINMEYGFITKNDFIWEVRIYGSECNKRLTRFYMIQSINRTQFLNILDMVGIETKITCTNFLYNCLWNTKLMGKLSSWWPRTSPMTRYPAYIVLHRSYFYPFVVYLRHRAMNLHSSIDKHNAILPAFKTTNFIRKCTTKRLLSEFNTGSFFILSKLNHKVCGRPEKKTGKRKERRITYTWLVGSGEKAKSGQLLVGPTMPMFLASSECDAQLSCLKFWYLVKKRVRYKYYI